MIKLEIHCHTLYGSSCGKADSETIVNRYLDEGYNGVIITNHYCEDAFESYKGDNKKEKLDFYFNLYEDVKRIGERKGLKVFLGSEIKIENRTDYLLFGFEKSLFYDNKPLYEFAQKELFNLAEKNGLFFGQAHPFRKGITVGDPNLMHGMELFNGHYHHVNNNEKAKEFCLKNNLIGLSGTDFHTPNQPITAGVWVPDYVSDEKKFVECLFNRDYKLICDHDKYFDSLDKFIKGEIK